MNDDDILEERNRLLDSWAAAASGWGRRADAIREVAMPLSRWLIEHADPRPGERVLELAAGPGDTGFIAAARTLPGGVLICSDGTAAMLDVARGRARQQGIENVEFRQLQLEWIDLPTADVDIVLCRWGVMLTLDPAAALHECRRVLRPGGRLALAVWDLPAENPWTTIVQDSLLALGHVEPQPAGAPGMFSLSQPGQLEAMLADAGFTEITVEPVELPRAYPSLDAWLEETLDCSRVVAAVWAELDDAGRQALRDVVAERARPFADPTGALVLPGRSLAGLASA